jgi:tetratricopeptide (TPR) repeat protein
LTSFKETGSTGYRLLSDFYIFHGKLDEAITAINKGLSKYPSDLGLKRTLLKTLLLRGYEQDRQTANEILTDLEEQLPQDTELMKLRAQLLLRESSPQSLQAARDKLESVIKLEPTAVDAHLTLFDMAMQQRQYNNARDLAIRALGSNPDEPALMLARGRAELALKNTQMAAELANLIIQKDPNNIDALNLLVNAATDSMGKGLLDKARMTVKSAVDRNPADENMIILQSKLLVSMGLTQTAISDLETYCQSEEGGKSIRITRLLFTQNSCCWLRRKNSMNLQE